MALWSLGARELAVEFFSVAVGEDPALWRSLEAIEATTRDWRPNERLTMLSIHNQWLSTQPDGG